MASHGHSPSAKATIVGGLQLVLVVTFLTPPVVWVVARLAGTSDGQAAFFPPVDLAVPGLLVAFVAGAALTRRRLDSVTQERRVTRRRLGFIAGVLLAHLALDLFLSVVGSAEAAGQLAPVVAVVVGFLVAHRPCAGRIEIQGDG